MDLEWSTSTQSANTRVRRAKNTLNEISLGNQVPSLCASRYRRGCQPSLSLQQLNRQSEGHHHCQHRDVERHQGPEDPEQSVVDHAEFRSRHYVVPVYETWEDLTGLRLIMNQMPKFGDNVFFKLFKKFS